MLYSHKQTFVIINLHFDFINLFNVNDSRIE
jgi:hypothetical protein